MDLSLSLLRKDLTGIHQPLSLSPGAGIKNHHTQFVRKENAIPNSVIV